jgi:Tol biopolymer transport system component
MVEFLNRNLIVTDLRRHVTSRVATGGVRHPVLWSPDGSRLGYARANSLVVYAVDAAKETVVATSPRTLTFQGWMPDGRSFLYAELGPDGKHSLWVKSVETGVPARRLLNTPNDESHAAVSADGKWLAYATDESGRLEVYAQALGGGPRIQVSSQGGNTPTWRRDGRELFYQAIDGSVVSVEVNRAGDRLDLSTPKVLFALPAHYVSGYSYDPAADGQRFLVLASYRRQPREPLTVVVNWPALLPN